MFKSLGIYFSKDIEKMISLNFEDRMTKFKNLLHMWSMRDLSLKGKITILNSLALPQLLYTSSGLFVPNSFIENVDKEIVKFVWNNKPPKVKTSKMIGNIDEGGL